MEETGPRLPHLSHEADSRTPRRREEGTTQLWHFRGPNSDAESRPTAHQQGDSGHWLDVPELQPLGLTSSIEEKGGGPSTACGRHITLYKPFDLHEGGKMLAGALGPDPGQAAPLHLCHPPPRRPCLQPPRPWPSPRHPRRTHLHTPNSASGHASARCPHPAARWGSASSPMAASAVRCVPSSWGTTAQRLPPATPTGASTVTTAGTARGTQ